MNAGEKKTKPFGIWNIDIWFKTKCKIYPCLEYREREREREVEMEQYGKKRVGKEIGEGRTEDMSRHVTSSLWRRFQNFLRQKKNEMHELWCRLQRERERIRRNATKIEKRQKEMKEKEDKKEDDD